MCGIVGKISRTGHISRELIHEMCERLVHRGPDSEGIRLGEGFGIGQRRLSIIDLAARATPPLSNEADDVFVVFNGEIYNFEPLRCELIERGHQFSTKTDTEVIVHAYEEYGIECINRFNGMFAIAVVDMRENKVFLARDRLGKKPLFYSRSSGSLHFGSEPKALFADPDLQREPDWEAIDLFLTYRYIPSPKSAFKGVSKLEPGSWLSFDMITGDTSLSTYWKPPRHTCSFQGDFEEAKLELRKLLNDSIRLRMIADVPIGAFLSGGLDSTSIVALMAIQSSRPIKTFTVDFCDEGYSESKFAEELAKQYNTDHHTFMVEPELVDLLPSLAYHYNEPFADISAIPTFHVSKISREHVTVALTGDGGDESFAGYKKYHRMENWERWSNPVFRSAKGLDHFFSMLPQSNRVSKARRAFSMLSSDLRTRSRIRQNLFVQDQDRKWFLHENFLKKHRIPPDPFTDPILDECNEVYELMMRHDQRYYLPDLLMVKSDIASMANSLELRAPLMDYRIVEFCASLPRAWKAQGGVGKIVLREMARDLLPESILNKRKTGFSVPIGKWFRGPLKDMVQDLVLSRSLNRRQIFNPDCLRVMVDEHMSGKRDWGNRLFSVLMLELWFRQFID